MTLTLGVIAEQVDVVAVHPPPRLRDQPGSRGRGGLGDRRGRSRGARGGLDGRRPERASGLGHPRSTTTNPFQPTLRFRGFSASPLLGLPQGIAVYQNGVRINEPFGDTVQFDLFPQFAVDRVQLSAGADPPTG